MKVVHTPASYSLMDLSEEEISLISSFIGVTSSWSGDDPPGLNTAELYAELKRFRPKNYYFTDHEGNRIFVLFIKEEEI